MSANRDLLRKLEGFHRNNVSYEEAYFMLQSVLYMALHTTEILHDIKGRATLHQQVQCSYEALLDSLPEQVVPQEMLLRLVKQAMAVLKRGIETVLVEPGEQRIVWRLLAEKTNTLIACGGDYNTILALTGSATHDADRESVTTFADTVLSR